MFGQTDSNANSRLLYAVRHGQSVWNAEGRLTGWTDVALTDLGRAQASALQPLLHEQQFDSVWSSPLERARETALLAWGNRFGEDELIKEFNFGDHEGRLAHEMGPDTVRALMNFESYHPPGGELGADFFARVDRFSDALPIGRHLVFTHGGIIRRFFHRLGLPSFPGNAGIFVFDLETNALLKEIKNPL